MNCEPVELKQRILGAWVYYGPSRAYPIYSHLQMRLCWWWGGCWFYLNPTRSELEHVYNKASLYD